MFAGVMPTSDWPGVMMPGQFGPMMRVSGAEPAERPDRLAPFSTLYAHAYALSCTGIPSVMTTSSGISASIASMIASLANLGGTKMIDTSAPVFSIASTTVPNTGSSMSLSLTSLCDTVVPALRAFTPPTICVPALSIRAVCVVASPPVMPWTMTLLSLVKKIAMSVLSGLRGFGRFGGRHIGGFVHRAHFGHEWVVGLGQDAAALVDVVAVQADHQRLVRLVAEDLQSVDDAVGNRVARGDAAE